MDEPDFSSPSNNNGPLQINAAQIGPNQQDLMMGKFNNTVVLKKGTQPVKGAPPPLAGLASSVVATNGVTLFNDL